MMEDDEYPMQRISQFKLFERIFSASVTVCCFSKRYGTPSLTTYSTNWTWPRRISYGNVLVPPLPIFSTPEWKENEWSAIRNSDRISRRRKKTKTFNLPKCLSSNSNPFLMTIRAALSKSSSQIGTESVSHDDAESGNPVQKNCIKLMVYGIDCCRQQQITIQLDGIHFISVHSYNYVGLNEFYEWNDIITMCLVIGFFFIVTPITQRNG